MKTEEEEMTGSEIEQEAGTPAKAWADWVRPVGWQHYCHATFPYAVNAGKADKTFQVMLNHLEKMAKVRICCAWSQEHLSKTAEAYVGEHFHFVLAAHKLLEPENVKATWLRLVCRENDVMDDSIRIAPYDPRGSGLEYIFKGSDRRTSEPNVRNLEYYHPKLQPTLGTSHRSLRNIRRWKSMLGTAQGG